jgi:endonuclease/exonuclease/phosphatase family metal-dependent hydrolase
MRPLRGIGLALVLIVLGIPSTGASDAVPEPGLLRVVSYNVHHGGAFSGLTGRDDDLETRLQITIDELRALNPDVVGLQEASFTRRRRHLAERLGQELGLHAVWAQALFRFFPSERLNAHIGRFMAFGEGPAILTRFPVVRWDAHDLPRCGGVFDPRVLVYATLRTPWGNLDVASTHTTRGFCEVERVVALLEERRGTLPTLLIGDFNAEEDSPAIRRLTRGAGFVDVFRAANPSALGLTLRQDLHARASTVRRRVDYIFLVAGRAIAGRVRASRVVLDQPRTRVDGTVLWPSDHYGVLAEIEVFEEPASPE